jgi:uncharacterized protein (DUF362 family)
MTVKTTRRKFLAGAVAAAAWAAAYTLRRKPGVAAADIDSPGAASEDPELTPRAYLPLVCRNYPPVRVVHVRGSEATYWDFSTGWYGNYVRQNVVDGMVEDGLIHLAGEASVAAAWRALLPVYQPGQKIAVKVNLNNASCSDTDNRIDALIEPVNALIRSLIAAGIREEDVWVYDALRPMPSRFYSRRQYTQARYFDSAGCADARATFNLMDDSLRVTFSHSAMRITRWLTDLLYEATYVINMPIIKRHGTHPVTLGFKNHFGSLNNLGGGGDDNPHIYIRPTDSHYDPNFSPLVDINANANIAGKTVLTMGDALFGASSVGATPSRWGTFGDDAPNSLLFSRDAVAIDCVMCDLLDAEWGVVDATYDYLRLAEQRGLGRFERGDPWGSGYTHFEYVRVGL